MQGEGGGGALGKKVPPRYVSKKECTFCSDTTKLKEKSKGKKKKRVKGKG